MNTSTITSFVDSYKEFAAKNGAPVHRPPSTSLESRLAVTASHLRGQFLDGKLTSEQVKLIEPIDGWKWSLRSRPSFTTTRNTIAWYVQAVSDFIAAEGRNPRPSKTAMTDEEAHLGNWMINVRAKNNRGELTAADIAKIETIPGWVWRGQNIKISVDEGIALYLAKSVRSRKWRTRMRRDHKAGTLSVSDITKIEDSIPGWTW
jgi:hypothetical protein